MKRWLRAPPLHFVLLGALIFALDGRAPGSGAEVPAPEPLVIDAGRVAQLRADYVRRTGFLPGPDDLAALLEETIDEELLLREARALGLDRDDRSIRWRLVEKMRFLADDPGRDEASLLEEALELGLERDDPVVRRLLAEKLRLLARAAAPEPSQAELRDHFEATRARYREPERVDLWHVFLDGAGRDSEARRLAARLRAEQTAPEQAVARGDAFPLGHQHPGRAEGDLAKLYGAAFAAAVLALPPGRWSQPLRSPYGTHLVQVVARRPGRDARFESVRGQVRESLRAERGDAAVAALLARLRGRQPLRVEAPHGDGEGDA